MPGADAPWWVNLAEGTVELRDVTPYVERDAAWDDSAAAQAAPRVTIAYLAQVAQVLDDLPHQQLPPFGVVVYAFAMTGRRSEVTDALAEAVEQHEIFRDVMALDARQLLHRLYRKLPEAYRSGEPRHRLLVTLCDENHQRLSKRRSRQVLGEMKSWRAYDFTDLLAGSRGRYWLRERETLSGAPLSHAYRALDTTMRRYGSLRAILAAADALPDIDYEELDLELETGAASVLGLLGGLAESKRPLLEQLAERRDTAPLAALQPLINAGLRLSPRLRPAEEVGVGATDLSNRGTVDRLLLTEHAYPPELFTARLANHEALYLHRERPPAPTDEPTAIAVEITLRMWGTPRLLAYGIALAAQLRLARERDGDGDATRTYFIGEDAREAPTATRRDWSAALRHQSIRLDAVPGLRELADARPELDRLLLVTHPRTPATTDFARWLRERPGLRVQLLTVDGGGRVANYHVRAGRQRLLHTFQIDLSVLPPN